MAMTSEQSANVMNDFGFRGKVKVSALQYADSIFSEGSSVPAHTSRIRWASETYRNPDQAAVQLHAPVVMDGGVQAAGVDATGKSLASDNDILGAVATVVGKML